VKALLAAGAEINGRAKVLAGAPVGRGRGSETSFQSAHSTFPRGGFTPMLFAAREGSLAATRVLVEAGADVNLPDPDGISPTMMSIINGHYDTAAALIRAPGVNVNAVDKAGRTALYFAADMHRLEWLFSRPTPKPSGDLDSLDVVKLLLERQANPNARLTGRPFAIHHDSNGHPSLVEGSTPFMKAASTSDVALMRILLEHGADPSLTTKNGTTSMMLAAGLEWREIASLGTEQESLEALELLAARGGDVNAANAAGETALHGAAQRGADEIVRWLVEHGARLDATNAAGRTPLDEAKGQANGSGDAVRRPERLSTEALLRELMNRTPAASRP
jgi:ankyrin repeat protein